MKIAKDKCWVAEDGKTLVPDGDEKAAFLVAVKGQSFHESQLANFSNAKKFFGSEDDAGSELVEKEADADLSSLTKAELIDLAADRGIDSAGLNKQDLLDKLSA